MLPNETFLQFTNFNFPFDTDSSISAEIIDVCGNILKVLQSGFHIAFKPFINTKTGKNQLVFELCTDVDFGEQLVMLKFTSSGKSIYSYPFYSTVEKQEETSKFYFKKEGYFKGIPYSEQNYFQTVRLRCFKNDSDQETENEELLQLSGRKYYSRNTTTPVDRYLFYLADFFVFNRLVALLSHPIIYIDSQRATSTPSKINKGERIPDTNLFQLDFEANPIEEYLTIDSQLLSKLEVVSLDYPDNSILLLDDGVSNRFTVTFNKDISIYDGSIKFHLYKNGTLIKSATPVSSGTTLYADFDHVFDVAKYHILVDGGKAGADTVLQNVRWSGFSNPDDWNFEVTEYGAFIEWSDHTTEDKSGTNESELVNVVSILDEVNVDSTIWQLNGIDKYAGNDSQLFEFDGGLNEVRLKVIYNDTSIKHSNVLKYTRQIAPTLKSVTKINPNTGRFIWNNNGVDYGSGTCILQLSSDNGATWENFHTAIPGSPSSDNTLEISSATLEELPNNIPVKFRILESGNGLVDIPSNIIEKTWSITSALFIRDAQELGGGNFAFKLHVEGAPFVGYGGITATRSSIIVKSVKIFTYGAFAPDLSISGVNLSNNVSQPVTIPVGIYNCQVHVTSAINIFDEGNVIGEVYYGFTPNFEDRIDGLPFHVHYPDEWNPI